LIQSIQENYLINFPDESYSIPNEISLSAYPNPFNPSCNIDIDLEHDLFVQIMVNDLLGHEVKLLNNKVLRKGSHQFSWEARDHPNGIYFITTKQNKFIQTRKITLLK